jgi:hypothetical protein
MNLTEYGMAENVPHDRDRLTLLDDHRSASLPDDIVRELKRDQAVLIGNVSPRASDDILAAAAERLGLLDQLELQAGYASLLGHRERVGKYFMTVNKRNSYEFNTPHSEGGRRSAIQLAAFYCYKNTTDGGFTILHNVDQQSRAWSVLRECMTKVDLCGKRLSPSEIAMMKARHRIVVPDDTITPDDQILSELPPPLPGIRCYKVLAKTKKTRSRIVDADVSVYWDDVASVDYDSAIEYMSLLEREDLLRRPDPSSDVATLDYTRSRKVYSSGVAYKDLFRSMIVHKLAPAELIVFNNLTWTHSVSNWTAGSGERSVVAAFA